MDTRKISYSNPFNSSGMDRLSDILGAVKSKVRNSPIGQGVISLENLLTRVAGPETIPGLGEALNNHVGALDPSGMSIMGRLRDISHVVAPAKAELARRAAEVLRTNPNSKASLVKASVPPQLFNKYQPELSEVLGGGRLDPLKLEEVTHSVDPRYNISTNQFPYGATQQTLRTGADQDVLLLNAAPASSEYKNSELYSELFDNNVDSHPQIKGLSINSDADADDFLDGTLTQEIIEATQVHNVMPYDLLNGDTFDVYGDVVENLAPEMYEDFINLRRSLRGMPPDTFHRRFQELDQRIQSHIKSSPVLKHSDAGYNNIGWFRGDQLSPDNLYYKGANTSGKWDQHMGKYLIDEIQSDLDTWKPKNFDYHPAKLNEYDLTDVLKWAKGRGTYPNIEEVSNYALGNSDSFLSRILDKNMDSPIGAQLQNIVKDFSQDKAYIPVGPNLKDTLNPVGDAYKGWEDTMMTNLIQHAIKDKASGIYLHSPESIVAKGDAAGRIDSVNEKYYDKLPKRFGFDLTTDHPFGDNFQSNYSYENMMEMSDDMADLYDRYGGNVRKVPMWYLDLSDYLR